MTLTTIGFDADDTLWQNEIHFRAAEQRFAALLGDFAGADQVQERLLATERRNLPRYGFGIKGFVLSMIETAVDLSQGRAGDAVTAEILRLGQEMLAHPAEVLPHAREAVSALGQHYRTVLITKGDLLDQERKLAQSGLGDLFDAVEIVSDKTADTYTRIFARHGSGAGAAMMVGNSLKSDILPILTAGGWGVHIPHELTWAFEHAEAPLEHPRFRRLKDLSGLAKLVADMVSATE